MKNLSLDDQTAKRIYPTAAPELKEILEKTFTKEFFFENITDRIKTFKDACDDLAIETYEDAYDILKLNQTGQELRKITTCDDDYLKLQIIIHALNEKWTPNWKDENEIKYYPYFKFNGKGFSFNFYCDCGSGTDVSSRLVFKSKELAIYAAKQFEREYNNYLIIQ